MTTASQIQYIGSVVRSSAWMHYGPAAAEIETVDACGARMENEEFSSSSIVSSQLPTKWATSRPQVSTTGPSAQSRNDDV
jgi:hypothetical protein